MGTALINFPGGGEDGGAFEMGVTDGSNAPPGAIGEVIVVSTSALGGGGGGDPVAVFQTDMDFQQVAYMTVSAGDWQVGTGVHVATGVAGGAAGPPMNSLWVYLGRALSLPGLADNLDTALDVGFYGIDGVSMTGTDVNVGPIRISTNTTTLLAVYAAIGTGGAAGPAWANFTVWARRMR